MKGACLKRKWAVIRGKQIDHQLLSSFQRYTLIAPGGLAVHDPIRAQYKFLAFLFVCACLNSLRCIARSIES
jgi:hypothetical protein